MQCKQLVVLLRMTYPLYCCWAGIALFSFTAIEIVIVRDTAIILQSTYQQYFRQIQKEWSLASQITITQSPVSEVLIEESQKQ